MKKESLYEAIGGIGDDLLEESEQAGLQAQAEGAAADGRKKRARILVMRSAAAAAACFVLAVSGLMLVGRGRAKDAASGNAAQETFAAAATETAAEAAVQAAGAAMEEAAPAAAEAGEETVPETAAVQAAAAETAAATEAALYAAVQETPREAGAAAAPAAASGSGRAFALRVPGQALDGGTPAFTGASAGTGGTGAKNEASLQAAQAAPESAAQAVSETAAAAVTEDAAAPAADEEAEGSRSGAGLADRLAGPEGAALFLAGDDRGNHVYSPLNLAMTLAMLAETTDGETRAQVLELLGADSAEAVRAQIGQLWQTACYDTERGQSLPAASVWLRNDGTQYSGEVLDRLAETFRASCFAGEMGSEEYDRLLQDWLNENTKGLLQEQAGNVHMTDDVLAALAGTLYYHADWVLPFEEYATSPQTFHAPDGDVTADMMRTGMTGRYWRGEHFGAVRLALRDGLSFWVFLPDEGYTPEDVVTDEAYGQILKKSGPAAENAQDARILLQLPRFDVSQDGDIIPQLKALGLTDIFDAEKADLSPLMGPEAVGALSKVQHAARVKADEYGVTAAAFTVEVMAGSALPPQKQVEFTCDRPFVFAAANEEGLVWFAGTVNRPE